MSGPVNKVARGLKYDTFQHTQAEIEAALRSGKPVVALCYQAFCDPCRATKPHLEALARKHGFHLIRIDGSLNWSPEAAGEIIPHIQVHWIGDRVSPPLPGAQTSVRIEAWLERHGVIQPRLCPPNPLEGPTA